VRSGAEADEADLAAMPAPVSSIPFDAIA